MIKGPHVSMTARCAVATIGRSSSTICARAKRKCLHISRWDGWMDTGRMAMDGRMNATTSIGERI